MTGRRFIITALLLLLLAELLVVVTRLRPGGRIAAAPRPAAPAAAQLHPSAPATPHRLVYVVRAGDTLTAIGRRLGVPVAVLAGAVPDPDNLNPGQRIEVDQ